MYKLKILFYLSFMLLLFEQITAQIVAPEFICVKEDTLFWNPAVNSCGPFNSVDIFKSNDKNGPYTMVTSITDPTITLYIDPDPSPSFYYLQSNHSCVGQNVISSDTLGNQFQQLITKIERVSVQGDQVHISWYSNSSPQTIGYIIYRITSIGTIPIDTVFSGLSYIDATALPSERVESYYVLGMNACGSTNTFDANAHSTILLNTEVDFCRQHIKLTWNEYRLWENGIENNQIWLGFDSAPAAFEHQVSGSDTLAYITGVIDDGEYCLSILAKENGRDVTSSSNEVCVITDVLSPLNILSIKNATVSADEDVLIDWEFNSDADISRLVMQRGNDSIAFTDLSPDISVPTFDINQYTDFADVQSQPYFYQLSATDDCDSTIESNHVATVHLRILAAQEGENELAWSSFHLPGRNLDHYEICRINQGVESSLSIVDPNQRFHTDVIPLDQRSEISCYLVKAHHSNVDGSEMLVSRSNQICAEQKVDLYIPNAFVPEGENNLFIPEFINQPNNGYQMTIFNRWGGKVFVSTNITNGWNGMLNGTEAESGVYFYIVEFPQPDGSQELRAGTVTLIR